MPLHTIHVEHKMQEYDCFLIILLQKAIEVEPNVQHQLLDNFHN